MSNEPHDPDAATLGLSREQPAPDADGFPAFEELSKIAELAAMGMSIQELADAIKDRPSEERAVFFQAVAFVAAMAKPELGLTFDERKAGMLRFSQVTSGNVRRCEGSFHPIADWSPTDWATALAGEVGELCNLIKKLRRGDQISAQAVADEMADVFLYLDLLAMRMHIDLPAAIIGKFNSVSVRVGSEVRL